MGQAENTCQVIVQPNDAPMTRGRLQSARSQPVLSQSSQNTTIQEDEKTFFQVRANGQPKPQVIGYQDNQQSRNIQDYKVYFTNK
jgi:hypothetical protein